MNGIQSSRIYYINSQNRLAGSDSSFSYRIPMDDQYTHVCVLQASIPMSFYLVRDGFNTFTLNENGTDIDIVIKPGNYNYSNFITEVKNKLNNFSVNNWVYSVVFDTQTAKYTYSVTNNGGIQPMFTFGNHLSQQFGFETNKTYSFVGDALVSSNVVNFVPEGTIFIHSNIVNSDTSILQEVYSNNTIPFSNIVYELTTDVKCYSKKLRTNTSNVFNFSITDEATSELYLNGNPVLITLLLWKEDNFSEMFKKYIKYSMLQGNAQ